MLRRFVPDPFLLYLLATVALATILPARGEAARLVGWLSTITVVLLFFFHGAKLAREQVLAGLTAWRLHLVILASTFVAFPLVGVAASRAFPGLLPPAVWTGILFLCALPSTVQSSIALVGLARGNVPAAVASASASQMLGIVLTPTLMGLIAGAHGGGGGLAQIGAVALQILVPFVAGHLSRPLIGGWVARHKRLVGMTDRATILIAVYGAFSAAVIEGLWHRVPPAVLAAIAAADIVLLALGLGFTWGIGRMAGLPVADRITVQFCGTKKSLVQGVPMAKVLFPGPEAGVILLPIMLFHQMQLMACTYLAQRYATRADDDGRARNGRGDLSGAGGVAERPD